jgi:hypothetical protein
MGRLRDPEELAVRAAGANTYSDQATGGPGSAGQDRKRTARIGLVEKYNGTWSLIRWPGYAGREPAFRSQTFPGKNV